MRYLRYTVLLLAIVLWGAGLSGSVSHWLYETGVIKDVYRYGDLYRMSMLPQFKQAPPECAVSSRSSDTASTQLYILGDSFTEPKRIGKSDFRVSHFQYVAWADQKAVKLDPDKRNVLLIESVERHVRDHFGLPITQFVVKTDTTHNVAKDLPFPERVANEFHFENVEERLESTLFSQDWAFWFKELKASLTLNWFDRANASVSLSKNHKHLFLGSDTDANKPLNSSFSTITDREIAVLVDSVNAVANRYKRAGFDAVYLSLIPNKASILESNRAVYNHLIERIQSHPNLQVPTVDTYTPFKNSLQSPYLISDTHWNCKGQTIWLDLVRQKIGI